MRRLKPKHILAIVVAALVLTTWLGYQRRIRIANWIWHVRHDSKLIIADHLVPVPSNWYVEDSGAGLQVLVRLDRNQQAVSEGLYVPPTITLLDEPPLKDIHYWESFVTSRLKEKGADPVLRRELNLDSETLSCVGGSPLPALTARKMSAIVSWDCRSPNQLEIMIAAHDADMEQAWDIISHIRQVSRP